MPAAYVASDAGGEHHPGAAGAVRAGCDAAAELADGRVAVARDGRRAAALHDAAPPGEVLVASDVASEAAGALPAGAVLVDVGVHRLGDLSPPQRVFVVRGRDDGTPPPRLRSLDRVATNLPVELTTFVGRRTELAAVTDLVRHERLVTLAGPGGCGKSRLAAHVAAGGTDRWVDGIWWVGLHQVVEADAVGDLVAVAVGAPVDPAAGPLASVTRQLRDRRALICVDNCEHVAAAAAETVEALIASCPDVTVLATSREPLGVPGELVWRVPTLAADEALELFADRARRVDPGFTVSAGNEDAVRRLCGGLDGIPLAVELAAGWAGTLTPRQIGEGLHDRFSLLVWSVRGTAPRHRTLAASIDWSYELLAERQRTVLRRLAVFRGGFSLDAARAVCDGDDVPVVVRGLVDRSLLVAEPEEGSGETRFRMLDTIRHYAWDRLGAEVGEADETRDRHLDHLLAVAEAVEPELDQDKDAWRRVVEPELDNLRAALDWGLAADDPERGRRLAASTAWLWNLHGRGREGIEVLRRAIDRAPHDRTRLQARLLTGFATIGDTAAPDELDPARQGASIAGELGDDRLRGRCLVLLAVGAFYGDFDTAWERCAEALVAARAAGDEYGADGALGLRGLILHFRDDHDAARGVLEPVVERLIRRGDRGIASTVLVYLSGTMLYTGDAAAARGLAERAAEVAEPLGDYHRVGTTRGQLALLHGLAGDIDGGLARLEPFLQVVEGAGPEVFVPGMAHVVGRSHLWRGDLEEAVHWLSPDALAAGPIAGTQFDAQVMPSLADALRRLGRRDEAAAVLDRAEAIARRMGLQRVLADGLDQRVRLALDDVDPDRAAELGHGALAIRVEHGLRWFYVDSLDLLAHVLAATERHAEAARLLAATDRARRELEHPRRPVDRAGHDAVVRSGRAALGDREAGEAHEEGRGLSLDDAVALARRSRGRRGRPSAGWASLTPTELEVVRLVVDGLTNPEIGRKLFMSRGTVKTHLSHVFAKLRVANRTELATLAADRLDRG